MSCRLAPEQLPPAEFDSLACAGCFYFIYMVVQPYAQMYYSRRCPNGLLICTDPDAPDCNCLNSNKVYNIPEYALNRSSVTSLDELELDPPLPEAYFYLTRQCCEAARQCCKNTLLPASLEPEEVCGATWDGWQCFKTASPGVIMSYCPPYIYGDHARINVEPLARKNCGSKGWAPAPGGSDGEWTDYSGCMVQHEANVKLFAGMVAFSISALFLLPAIVILFVFRQLRNQPMFILHRHLLISFLLYGLFYLFNCFFFIVDGAPGDILYFTNHLSCRFLFTVQLRFLRLSTFSWMLAEGVYLYRLLNSSSHEGESLTPYKILCWGVPAVVAAIYGVLREIFDNEGCWVSPSVHSLIEWTVIIPCLVALCVNMLLVTVIMFILVKKLRCDSHLERIQYRKAVRAALMLIPVFGLHFLLTIYRFPDTTHQVINLVLDGLQGCAVSIIICYTNRNVAESAIKWYSGLRESRAVRNECRARACSQQVSAPLVIKQQRV